MKIGEYFFLSAVDQFYFCQKKNKDCFFPDKVDMGRGGVRVRIRV